ncbi:MAG TPA: 4-hydroxythreonine-4-phosphate dehydrogenase PdxA [Chthonomonadales bacterium]|nr:4-hydroxythreonine-4-phosphate dehydrogenase PdxA [Chthonomonadales bacterium]
MADLQMSGPRIAVTMGDPAGIGPEVALKALARQEIACRPLLFGDMSLLRRTARSLQLPLHLYREADGSGDAAAGRFQLPVRQATVADLRGLQEGAVSAQAGRAAAQCVLAATKAALASEVDAIVTAPLSKEAMALGGYPYPGHTELLAQAAGARSVAMMLVSGGLRVVHVSAHVSLAEAISRVQIPRVVECIRLGAAACRRLGIEAPRIAVAGLNPHAGEGGMFGTEESDTIAPAIEQARAEGLTADGPYPPDTVFARAVAGNFDLVVAMYHDQGHIPVKLHGFDTGVNVTLGLPIVRTSPDHGVAFDIAGKGVARESSMAEAIRVAARLCNDR